MINLQALGIIIGFIMLLAFFFKFMNKLHTVTYGSARWLLIGLGVLVLAWGIYNYMGYRFQLWEPLSLDTYINALAEKLNLKDWLDSLNKILKI
ncbi:MAG: hypothetical protein B6U76_01020 [Desulfurococcales archaeon ex4484_217_2]|nr:MAG: hypothetical protein B6U76_01020 [Desulfurococcales archaeon ex4484_217_2]